MARNINSRTRSAVRTQSRKDVRPHGEKYKPENREWHLKTESEGREITFGDEKNKLENNDLSLKGRETKLREI